MENLTSWLKSTRSIAVVLFAVGVHIALFMRIMSPEVYGQALMLVLGAYFAKRDTPDDRLGGETKSESQTTVTTKTENKTGEPGK